MKEKWLSWLFSTRLTAVLFVLFAAAMAIGTFVESIYSTETARIYIYDAKWFEWIMLIFVVNFIGNIGRYRLWRWEKWPLLLLHLSWILIIVGAGITRYISFEGMMPIREGATENVFYSSETYLTAHVDGRIDGQPKRKVLEDEILITEQGRRSRLPWRNDFNGIPFRIELDSFTQAVREEMRPDPNGELQLKIVESSGGGRHDHYLTSGQVSSIHNVLVALNKPTEGAINITAAEGDSIYTIESPYTGTYMRMRDQLQGELAPDSVQRLQLRSLYQVAGLSMVFPDPLSRMKKTFISIPKEEQTENDISGIWLKIRAGGESHSALVLGGQGQQPYSDPVEIGDLSFRFRYGSKVRELPFEIRLNDFIAEKYPGTERSYSSFMSKITVFDERPFDYDIYMNHVLDHRGYRFFQASFDPDELGTVLSVNHDFWGTWITYIGYFLLYAGLLGLMFFGKTRFKTLAAALERLNEKKKQLATGLLLLIAPCVLSGQQTEGEAPHSHRALTELTPVQIDSIIQSYAVDQDHADKFAEIVIQDRSRMKPVHTFASELLRKLSRKNQYLGLSPEQVMLSMMMQPAVWINAQMVVLDSKAQNDSIRSVIGVPSGQKYVRVRDFFDEEGNSKMMPYLQDAYATQNPDKFQQDFIKVDQRLGLLNRALTGEIVKIFPLLNDPDQRWISALEFRSGRYQVQDSAYAAFIGNGMPLYLSMLRKAVQTGDYSEADQFIEYFKVNQRNNGKELMPSEQKVRAEIFYNRLDLYNRLYKVLALTGLLLFLFVVMRLYRDRTWLKAAITGIKAIIVLAAIGSTSGLVMRWYISGHAPWSDAYESILYVSWATLIIGLAFGRKSDLTIAASTFVSSMLLWIAHQSWVDPEIASLQPVLNSYWLMIHVAVIVGSYGPLTIGMILGISSLILILLTNKRNKERIKISLKEITIVNELALTVGLVMLTIGNFLGGQWANESWGRYWGWDPKETWALISIMVYAFVLHMRLVPGLQGRWAFNFASIVAYGSIMMTYFGVNFYLVGLHSYASGEQVITPSFVWYTVIGVLVLGGVSLYKYRREYAVGS